MLALQRAQQAQDLCLDRQIERAHRLVAHQQRGPYRDGPGDAHALALASAELMRIGAQEFRGQLHLLQDLAHPVPNLPWRACSRRAQRLGDRLLHRPAGIQRVVRVLEDDLHAPAQAFAVLGQPRLQRPAFEHDLAPIAVHQPHDESAQRRLAAAGFADQPERLARLHVEADVIHRAHPRAGTPQQAASHGETLRHLMDRQQRFVHCSVFIVRCSVFGVEPAPFHPSFPSFTSFTSFTMGSGL